MPIRSLNDLDDAAVLQADIAIAGGGACGLTLARALSGSGLRVLVLESGGLEEDATHEALNRVEMAEGCWQPTEAQLRDRYHRNLTRLWDGAVQGYGVRCRGLGGATQAWAGKSAPFDPIDYAARPWVPLSGWPIAPEDLAPDLARAAELLNLGPGHYDDSFWPRSGRRPPQPSLANGAFETMFWQFARSRRRATDIMRFGADFRAAPPADVEVLTHATVTRITSSEGGGRVTGFAVQSLAGRRATVEAPTCVLAASTIENARLLLLSTDGQPAGLGNAHDQVGRCLMDHPTATIARAGPGQVTDLAARFGLFPLRDAGRTYVYMHGLRLSAAFQQAEAALNGAVFVTEERAPDDPFAALRRLLRRRSEKPLADAVSVAKSPLRLARGAAARALERGLLPAAVSRRVVDTALRLFPNAVAQDYQSGRLPVKLSGLRFEATTEQPPDPENRVMLSDQRDALGLPIPRIRWTAGPAARDNLLRIGQALQDSFSAAGLPPPIPEPWLRDGDPQAAAAIDLGHPLGSTRMSADPRTGVVDADCAVHGVSGLYVCGGSVLPTSGHANPTLMMLAVTLRLSRRLLRRRGATGGKG